MNPTRPALRYHGGKWILAPWIIQHFPPHRTYTEVYGGAASVLMRKDPSYAELYNDLGDDVVNLFRVLQNAEQARLLHETLKLTPYARREFELPYIATDDPVEKARRLIIRSFMGFGSDGHNVKTKTGFRADSNKSAAHDWVNYPDVIPVMARRFRSVVIECRPALGVLRKADRADALHYIDPPYMPATRSQKSRRGGVKYHSYSHEMTIDDHVELLECAAGLTGMAVISGYPTALYDEKLAGWGRTERAAMADGAKPRTEVLWMNPACVEALARRHAGDCSPLFMVRA